MTPKKSVETLIASGAAAGHIEDQIPLKKCGHLSGKHIVSQGEMCDRIKAANHGRQNKDFYLIARTDSVAVEGLNAAITRAKAYLAAGADAIFAEALTDEKQYHLFCTSIDAPVLANMTEFGKTPLLNASQLQALGVQMILYPLSAFRAMNAAALKVYETIRHKGSQSAVLDEMQDRNTLYDILKYQV